MTPKRRARVAVYVAAAVLFLAVAAWAHWPVPAIPEGAGADRVVVKKSARVLELYRGPDLLRSYAVALGRHPLGHKQREGDGRTPEGHYVLDSRKSDSSFHLALHVSYPSPADRAQAQTRGDDPGGLIMIHGLRNGLGILGRTHRLLDWTQGCIAVTNREIEEIWRLVPDGTPITIEP